MTPSRKKPTLSLLAALLALAAAPAQAQFFPFFDNRPEPPREIRRQPIFRLKPKKPHIHPAPQHHTPAAGRTGPKGDPKAATEPQKPPPPVAEAPPPPYEPQLLRLAEIMGALAVLQNLCVGDGARSIGAAGGSGSASEDAAWRVSMQNLMESQEAGPARRERLAGAYNRGLRGYQYFYRHCTPSAELARARFLDEGSRLTHDIFVHYKEN